MENRIEQLIAELIEQTPELRGREEQLRGVLSELLSVRPDARIDATFRAELKRKLLVHEPLVRPAWYATWHRAYYPLAGVALLVLFFLIVQDQQIFVSPSSNDLSFGPSSAPLAERGSTNQPPSALMAVKNINLAMKLTSPGFSDNSMMPAKYTCDGEGLRPLLNIANIPAGTVSLALIVEDLDAPSGSFIHWTVWNIPPSTTEIGGALMIDGAVEGVASNGAMGWVAPCPPSGTHRYVFTLFALNDSLALSPGSSKAQLDKVMTGHVLVETSLTGLYQRQ